MMSKCAKTDNCKNYPENCRECWVKDSTGKWHLCYELKTFTNIDRIKVKSVEQMAKFIEYVASGDFSVDICGGKFCPEYSEINMTCSGNCKPAIAKWLESEVTEI